MSALEDEAIVNLAVCVKTSPHLVDEIRAAQVAISGLERGLALLSEMNDVDHDIGYDEAGALDELRASLLEAWRHARAVPREILRPAVAQGFTVPGAPPGFGNEEQAS